MNIEVIDMPLLNTTGSHDNLTGVFIADLVLQILAYVAETERSFIKQRQMKGIIVAKKRGVCFGRKKEELPEDFNEYYNKWKNKEMTIRNSASAININPSTFYRRYKERMNNRENQISIIDILPKQMDE